MIARPTGKQPAPAGPALGQRHRGQLTCLACLLGNERQHRHAHAARDELRHSEDAGQAHVEFHDAAREEISSFLRSDAQTV